ncbi:uncharacterized protein LOC128986829 [Macrosteles quadrilineatus]|uniref:uncharacterized protein LOC128986829 n=1 Tax=Macrosteles quadrilineatus TaxID=74068 RepID=UPI0023E15516|nr:uncharacterized protein LOC128986829 [Macrosteles quadrilineatus]
MFYRELEFDDSDSDPFDEFEYRGYYGRNKNSIRRRNEENLDIYFYKIQKSVIEEETKSASLTDEEEERLFGKINTYLQKPFAIPGIFTLQRLAFIPPRISADRLNELAKTICRNIFIPTAGYYLEEYVDFCKAFAYLTATTDSGNRIKFVHVLITAFLEELPKKFNYSQRVEKVLENRDIPLTKKQEWIQKQVEEYREIFYTATKNSTEFLKCVFECIPEIVLRVVEFLLKLPGEDAFEYLSMLLEKLRDYCCFHGFGVHERVLTDIYHMKVRHWVRNEHRNAVRLLGAPCAIHEENMSPLLERISALLRQHLQLNQQMWKIIHDEIISNNANKYCSQDYIKYSIKDCLFFDKLDLEDDFTIDDDDLYDCNVYTLRSKDFTGDSRKIFWNGLKVKRLMEKSKIPEQKTWGRGTGRFNAPRTRNYGKMF